MARHRPRKPGRPARGAWEFESPALLSIVVRSRSSVERERRSAEAEAGGSNPPGVAFSAKWRNWQTRGSQKPVGIALESSSLSFVIDRLQARSLVAKAAGP